MSRDILALLLQALRAYPTSYHFPSIIYEVNDRGEYVGSQRVAQVRQTLERIIQHAPEYAQLADELHRAVDAEKFDNDDFRAKLARLKEIELAVGGTEYTRITSMIAFLD